MQLYAFKLDKKIDMGEYNKFISCISEEKEYKVKKFVKIEDSQRSLFADILIRNIIVENLNIKNQDIIFYTNKYGKPYLKYSKPFYFNISHSGNWIVCATDIMEIGADIEKVDNIDLSIAEQFFSIEEYADILRKKKEDRLLYFYELWTLKESYLKAYGKGLQSKLNSFSININNNSIILKTELQFKNCFFKQYNVDKNYKTSVCGLNSIFPNEIVIKTFDDLYKIF